MGFGAASRPASRRRARATAHHPALSLVVLVSLIGSALGAISPEASVVGGTVVLSGVTYNIEDPVTCRFVAGAEDVAGSVVEKAPNEVWCQVPSMAARGTVSARVLLVDTVLAAEDFVLYDQPTGMTARNTYVPAHGGYLLHIEAASGLDAALPTTPCVFLHSTCYACTVESGALLECDITGASNNNQWYNVQVRLNSVNAASQVVSVFSYAAPTINGFAPRSGPLEGGTRTTVSASTQDTGTLNVTIADEPWDCTWQSTFAIECVTAPAGASGLMTSARVTIDNPSFVYNVVYNEHTTVGFNYYDPPTISHLSPHVGPVATQTTITIVGAFPSQYDWPYVRVGEAELSAAQRTTSYVSVTVPSNIALGDYHIKLAPNGQQFINTTQVFSTYEYPPLSGVEPYTYVAQSGSYITVTGTDFFDPDTPHVSDLLRMSLFVSGWGTWNDVACTFNSTTAVTCTTPNVGSAWGDGAVALTFNRQAYGALSTPVTVFRRPVLYGITPESGPLSGGTNVTVSGIFYDTGELHVQLAGVEQPCQRVSEAQVVCTMLPAPGAQQQDASPWIVDIDPPNVVFDGSSTLHTVFRYYDEPTIDTIEPALGAVEASTRITLSGTFPPNLDGDTPVVSFNGDLVSGHFENGNVVVQTPSRMVAGVEQVRVAINGQQFAHENYTLQFTVYEHPVITSLTPYNFAQMQGGSVITVHGTGFREDSGALLRAEYSLFGEVYGACTFNTTTHVVCTTPYLGFVGTATMRISLNSQQYTPSSLTLELFGQPSLHTIAPQSVPVALSGSVDATLTGDMFVTGSVLVRVSYPLGDIQYVVPAAVNTATELTWTVPTSMAPLQTTAVQVAVSLSIDGYDTVTVWSNPLSLVIYVDPVLTAITPPLGPISGGTNVQIVGTGFFATSEPVLCRFGDTVDRAVQGSVTGTSFVSCQAPAVGVHEHVSVAVAWNGVDFSPSTVGFDFRTDPTHTAMVPTYGPTRGSTDVTLSMDNLFDDFAAFARVLLDGSAITPSAMNGTHGVLTFATPGNDALLYDVQVSMNAQQYTVDAGSFAYYAVPNALDAVPRSAPVHGGTAVRVGIANPAADALARASDGWIDLGGALLQCSVNAAQSALDCVMPAHAAASVALTMSLDDTQYNAQRVFGTPAPSAFVFYDDFELRKVTPSFGPVSATTELVVRMDGFTETGEAVCRVDGDVSAAHHYRRSMPFVIVNHGATDYAGTVRLHVDTAAWVGAGTLRAECDDIRILLDDGTLLPHLLTGCNTLDSMLYMPVSIAAGRNVSGVVQHDDSSGTSTPERTNLSWLDATFYSPMDSVDVVDIQYATSGSLSFDTTGTTTAGLSRSGSAVAHRFRTQLHVGEQLGVSLFKTAGCNDHFLYLAAEPYASPLEAVAVAFWSCSSKCIASTCVTCGVVGDLPHTLSLASDGTVTFSDPRGCSDVTTTVPLPQGNDTAYYAFFGASTGVFRDAFIMSTPPATLETIVGADVDDLSDLLCTLSPGASTATHAVEVSLNGVDYPASTPNVNTQFSFQTDPIVASVTPSTINVMERTVITLTGQHFVTADEDAVLVELAGAKVGTHVLRVEDVDLGDQEAQTIEVAVGPLANGGLLFVDVPSEDPNPVATDAIEDVNLRVNLNGASWSPTGKELSLEQPALCPVVGDSFDPALRSFQWEFVQGAQTSDVCGAQSGAQALVFMETENNVDRVLESKLFDTTYGGRVELYVRFGDNFVGSQCNVPQGGAQSVLLQYSTTNGTEWTTLTTYSPTTNVDSFSQTRLNLPSTACAEFTQFRLFQTGSSPNGFFAVDDFFVWAVPKSGPTLHVSDIAPHSGYTSGGVRVTVTGTGFAEDLLLKCYFGDNEAAEVVYNGPTELECVAPPGVVGVVDVSVRECGHSYTSDGEFTYHTEPVISRVFPLLGETSGSQVPVTVYGSGFFTTEYDDEVQVRWVDDQDNIISQHEASPVAVNEPMFEYPLSRSSDQTSFPGTFSDHNVRAQFLVLGEELARIGMGASSVTRVQFEVEQVVDVTLDRLQVGIKSVSADNAELFAFESTTVLFDGTDFQYTVVTDAGTGRQFYEVTLDTPHAYDGTSNLIIEFVEWNENPPTVHGSTQMRNVYDRRGVLWSGVGDPLGGTAEATIVTQVANLRVCTAAGCPFDVVVMTQSPQSAEAMSLFPSVSFNAEQYVKSPAQITFELFDSWTFSEVVPELVPALGGSQVVVSGDSFPTVSDAIAKFYAPGQTEYVRLFVDSSTSLVVENTPAWNEAGVATLSVSMDGVLFASVGLFQFYEPEQISSISPVSGPQVGGEVVTVHGSNFLVSDFLRCRFGTNDFINNAESAIIVADVSASTTTSVVCRAPAHPNGVVNVFVSNNGADFSPQGALFQFDACPLGTFTPNYLVPCQPCAEGTFSDVPNAQECSSCPAGTYQPDTGQESCDICPENTVTAAGASTSVLDCECAPGFYGEEVGVACAPCPDGADCDGGLTDPFPKFGFWQQFAKGSDGFDWEDAFVECVVPESCPGGRSNECAEGYDGFKCSECASQYFRQFESCHECPNKSNPLVVFLIALVVVVAAGFVMAFGKFLRGIASLRIFVAYIQIAVYIPYFNLGWPSIVVDFASLLEIFSFRLDIVHPECQVDMAYPLRWGLFMGFPIVFAGLLVGFYFVIRLMLPSLGRLVFRDAKARERAAQSFGDQLFNLYMLFLVFSYIMLASKSLEPFDCTTQPDGTLVMDANPDIVCDDSDDDWKTLRTYSVLGVVFYVVGIPALLIGVLWFHRHSLNAERTMNRYGFLYQAYRRDMYAWEVGMVLLRKFSIVMARQLISNSPLIQALFAVGLLCVFLVAHIVAKPYVEEHINRLDFGVMMLNVLVLFIGLLLLREGFDGLSKDAVGLFIVALMALGTMWTVWQFCKDLYVRVSYRIGWKHVNKLMSLFVRIITCNGRRWMDLTNKHVTTLLSHIPQVTYHDGAGENFVFTRDVTYIMPEVIKNRAVEQPQKGEACGPVAPLSRMVKEKALVRRNEQLGHLYAKDKRNNKLTKGLPTTGVDALVQWARSDGFSSGYLIKIATDTLQMLRTMSRSEREPFVVFSPLTLEWLVAQGTKDTLRQIHNVMTFWPAEVAERKSGWGSVAAGISTSLPSSCLLLQDMREGVRLEPFQSSPTFTLEFLVLVEAADMAPHPLFSSQHCSVWVEQRSQRFRLIVSTPKAVRATRFVGDLGSYHYFSVTGQSPVHVYMDGERLSLRKINGSGPWRPHPTQPPNALVVTAMGMQIVLGEVRYWPMRKSGQDIHGLCIHRLTPPTTMFLGPGSGMAGNGYVWEFRYCSSPDQVRAHVIPVAAAAIDIQGLLYVLRNDESDEDALVQGMPLRVGDPSRKRFFLLRPSSWRHFSTERVQLVDSMPVLSLMDQRFLPILFNLLCNDDADAVGVEKLQVTLQALNGYMRAIVEVERQRGEEDAAKAVRASTRAIAKSMRASRKSQKRASVRGALAEPAGVEMVASALSSSSRAAGEGGMALPPVADTPTAMHYDEPPSSIPVPSSAAAPAEYGGPIAAAAAPAAAAAAVAAAYDGPVADVSAEFDGAAMFYDEDEDAEAEDGAGSDVGAAVPAVDAMYDTDGDDDDGEDVMASAGVAAVYDDDEETEEETEEEESGGGIPSAVYDDEETEEETEEEEEEESGGGIPSAVYDDEGTEDDVPVPVASPLAVDVFSGSAASTPAGSAASTPAGSAVGTPVAASVSSAASTPVGSAAGTPVAASVGSAASTPAGSAVGTPVAASVGSAASTPAGSAASTPAGSAAGTPVAASVGSAASTPAGSAVGTPAGSASSAAGTPVLSLNAPSSDTSATTSVASTPSTTPTPVGGSVPDYSGMVIVGSMSSSSSSSSSSASSRSPSPS